MDRFRVIQTLREHESELREAGILHLRLFGSLARDEGSQDSDVDLLAEFDRSKRLSLVTVGRLQSRLSELLGTDVDLSSAEWMMEPVRSTALSEPILAF
jgi:predicted nucleotidyltransferase